MKDGFTMKENFCFYSEREWTEDCSLEVYSESFMIGKVEKNVLGDTGRGQRLKPRKLLRDVFLFKSSQRVSKYYI